MTVCVWWAIVFGAVNIVVESVRSPQLSLCLRLDSGRVLCLTFGSHRIERKTIGDATMAISSGKQLIPSISSIYLERRIAVLAAATFSEPFELQGVTFD